jgi:hypothetical protein
MRFQNQRQRKRTGNASLCILCVGMLLTSSICACNHQAVDVTAPTSPAANQWIRFPPNPPFFGTPLDRSQWKLVPKAQQSAAEPVLQTASWVHLTEAQAQQLTGTAGSAVGKTMPYLLRAVGSPVGTSGFEIEVGAHGDVLVTGGALSHHAVPIERRAIVAWLGKPPHAVYVSFSVAE